MHELIDVFAEDIGFEIDQITGAAGLEIGDIARVRDDPDAEPVAADAGDGQADAIDGDRAFLDDVAHDGRRRFDVEDVILAVLFEPPHLAPGIDVAEDEVAVEPGIGPERALEVDASNRNQNLF